MRRLLLAALVVLLAAVAPPAGAGAATTTTDLAPIAADVPIAAYSGWVAWSEKGADGQWRLVTFHDGVKETPASVAPRSVPFDLDVGVNGRDRPAVTFSRCVVEPATSCRLRQVDLDSRAESGIPVPGRGAGSDSVPSLWGYRVAFQRRAKGASVSQIMMYDMQHRRMKRLRHGFVPDVPKASGAATAIDLASRTLAFSWSSLPADLGIGPRTELRAERTANGAMVGDPTVGYTSGACGMRDPRSPNATPTGALFLQLVVRCDRPQGALSALSVEGGPLRRAVPLPGLLRIARDAADGTVYGVRAVPGAGLRLVRLDGVQPFVTGS
jgi:hypothetical protein